MHTKQQRAINNSIASLEWTLASNTWVWVGANLTIHVLYLPLLLLR